MPPDNLQKGQFTLKGYQNSLFIRVHAEDANASVPAIDNGQCG